MKEVWKVAKPLDRVDPHDGLAAAHRRRSTASSAARSSTRWATTWSRSAWSSASTTATRRSRSHDLLQELKTHPKIRKILEGGERIEWGAKTIPSGGFHALPRELHAPGLLLCGDGVGMVNVPRSRASTTRSSRDGSPPRPRSRALQRGETPASALSSYDDAVRDELHLERPARGAEHAPGLRARLLRRRRARERDDDVEGPRRAREDARRSRTPSSRSSSPTATRATPRPTASSPSTSSRRSSPRATRRATTSRTTSGSSGGCRARSRSCGRTCARRRCTRPGAEDADGTVTVDLAPSNCVQCGAITAKGGRLTPPEGGSGPEYTRT